MRKPRKHLTYADRKTIEKLVNNGVPVQYIADIVGVHRATIYNELKRAKPYSADEAQKTIS